MAVATCCSRSEVTEGKNRRSWKKKWLLIIYIKNNGMIDKRMSKGKSKTKKFKRVLTPTNALNWCGGSQLGSPLNLIEISRHLCGLLFDYIWLPCICHNFIYFTVFDFLIFIKNIKLCTYTYIHTYIHLHLFTCM